LSEFNLLPARNCFILPENLSPAEGALIEPFSIGLYAWELFKAGFTRKAVPDRGLDLGILGAGPIGLSVLLAARGDGISSTLVTEPIAARRKIAERAGAAWAEDPDSDRLEASFRERAPLGLDAVFECCGEQSALDQAVDMLKPGGTLAVVGIPESDRVSFDIHRLRRKEIRILNVRRQNRCTGKAIALAAAGDVDLGFLATHRFPLERAAAAFELADGYRDGVLRAVIDFPNS
jgi:threonine dehydrogenase-like Zn-dependent dehydrogenase